MRIRPAGAHALLVEFASAAEVVDWHAELLRRRDAGELTASDVVPAARTLLLDGVTDPAGVAARLAQWPTPPPVAATAGALVEIPTVYDGPDLADVAQHWGTTPQGVVSLHTGTEFRVAFCGFAPGFGYLTGLPADRAVPRRATPRARVPVGAVGLAGEYTGVYPTASPGGWQLIGRTDTVLFDPDRDPPALFTPGARVRFVEQS
jgi:KipI family sensor histidine kinase inhibitor